MATDSDISASGEDALTCAIKALPLDRRQDIRAALIHQAERSADRHDLRLSALWVAIADRVAPPREQANDPLRPRLQQ
jgi:hypothetical protein